MSFTANPTGQTFVNNTDANFRIWGKFFSDSLTSAGIVQTSDTGQINWATVTAPAAINTKQGYEIRRFADTLQATKPVYIKFSFGSGGAAGRPSVWVTIGTGSDGAGNITSVLMAETQFTTAGVGTTADYKHVFSGDTDRFVMCWGYTPANSSVQCLFLSLERTKDSSNVNNSDGVLFSACTVAGIASYKFQVLPFTGTIPAAETVGHSLLPLSDSTLDGTDVGVFEGRFFNFGRYVNPGLNWFGYRTNEVAAEIATTISVDGSNHTYFPIPLSVNAFWSNFFSVSRNNNAIMVRYE
jgi:hypothetical protein